MFHTFGFYMFRFCRQRNVAALILSLITFLIFLTAKNNEFVDYDDYAYLPFESLRECIGLQTVILAFKSYAGANWHPLTLMSLFVDFRLWGNNPYGFHLTNILYHSLSVYFAYVVFNKLLCFSRNKNSFIQQHYSHIHNHTKYAIISSYAAMLFGIHPLRVESVVWASERKDVLCMFWLLISVNLYISFWQSSLEKPKTVFYKNYYYLFSFLSCVLALLSKPLAVSIPLIFIILDWYPFGRFGNPAGTKCALIEKAPFVIASLFCCIMTLSAQQIAIVRAVHVSYFSRFLIACKALAFYLFKMLWPSDLSAFYPHPGEVAYFDLHVYLLYVCGVLAITVLLICLPCRFRWLLALWLFYVLTLVPMLGVVQVGAQWVADRYSYLPSLGISLFFAVFVIEMILVLQSRGRNLLAVLIIALVGIHLMCLSKLTIRQINVWQTTETLMTNIINKIPEHREAPYYTRAKYYNEIGKYNESLADIDKALLIANRLSSQSKLSDLYIAKAHVLSNLNRLVDAISFANLAIDTSTTPHPSYLLFRNSLVQCLRGKASSMQ